MWSVTVDSISAAELDILNKATKRDMWHGHAFDFYKGAVEFAESCKDIVPGALVEVSGGFGGCGRSEIILGYRG